MSIKGKASPSKTNPGKVTSYLFAKSKEMQEIWLDSQGVMTSGSQRLTLHSFSKLIQGPFNMLREAHQNADSKALHQTRGFSGFRSPGGWG